MVHNDADMPVPKPEPEPDVLVHFQELLWIHPRATVIWATPRSLFEEYPDRCFFGADVVAPKSIAISMAYNTAPRCGRLC